MGFVGLDSLELGDGAIALGVACVEGGGGFKQEDVDFLLCYGAVFDSVGDDDEFSSLEVNLTVTEFHAEFALND